jgi:hypothetical protein
MTPTGKRGALLVAAVLLSGPFAFWLFLIVIWSVQDGQSAGHMAILVGALLVWLTYMIWWTRNFFRLAKRDVRRGFPVGPLKHEPPARHRRF